MRRRRRRRKRFRCLVKDGGRIETFLRDGKRMKGRGNGSVGRKDTGDVFAGDVEIERKGCWIVNGDV